MATANQERANAVFKEPLMSKPGTIQRIPGGGIEINVPGAPGPSKPPQSVSAPADSKSGGGGRRSSGNGPMSSPNPLLNTPVSSQSLSQIAQDQARTLSKQNEQIAEEARSRDSNYLILTKPATAQLPYQSRGTQDIAPQQVDLGLTNIFGTGLPAKNGTPFLDVIPTGKTPSSVQPARGVGEMLTSAPFETSFVEAAGQAAKNVFDFGLLREQGLSTYYQTIFAPFESSGFGTRLPNVNPAYRGTIIAEGFVPAGYKNTAGMNIVELKINQDLARGVPFELIGVTPKAAASMIGFKVEKSIQQRIDAGVLDYGTEGGRLNTLQIASTEYATQLDQYTSATRSTREIELSFQRFQQAPAKLIKLGVETAAFSVIGEIPEIKLGADFIMGRIGFQKTATGFASETSYLARLQAREDIAALPSAFKFSGRELLAGSEGNLFAFTAERMNPTGSLKQSVEFISPVFRTIKPDVFAASEVKGVDILIEKGTESTSFFVTQGVSKTKYFNFVTGKTSESIISFRGGGKFATFTEGFKIGGPGFRSLFPEANTGIGAAYLKLEGQPGFKSFKIFGATKETNEFYNVVGGNVKAIRTGFTETKIFGNVGGYGQIRKLSILEETDHGFTVLSGGGKSLQLPQLKELNLGPVQGFAERAGRETLGKSFKIGLDMPRSLAGDTFGSTSLFAGTGLYERTDMSFASPSLRMALRQERSLAMWQPSVLGISSGISMRSSSRSLMGFAQPIALDFRLDQPQPSAFAFRFAQGQTSVFKNQRFSTSPFVGSPNVPFPIGLMPFSPDIPGFELPSLGGFLIPNRKRRGRKSREFDIAPSFTGIIGKVRISSPLKVSKTFGVTPFQIRGLPSAEGKRRKKYFILTDI